MMNPHKKRTHETYWKTKCEGCDQHPMLVSSGCNWNIFECACETNSKHRKQMDFYWPMSKYTFKVEASQ